MEPELVFVYCVIMRQATYNFETGAFYTHWLNIVRDDQEYVKTDYA